MDALKQFFHKRIVEELNITDDENVIEIDKGNGFVEKEPIFTTNRKGIQILLYTLQGKKIFIKPKSKNQPIEGSVFDEKGERNWSIPYVITRLLEPYVKKNGDVMKYEVPEKNEVQVFYPPFLIKAYKEGLTIDTLYATEGYFKAFKATKHGIPTIGYLSISTLKDKETGGLHPELIKLIVTCKVKRFVWLTDGDCRNITGKEITDGIDLYKRPKQFFSSVATFYDLTSKLDNVLRYFAHINSSNIEGNPKGLDDLLISCPADTDAIVKEFNSFDKKTEFGNYLVRMNITYGIGKVHKYFLLHDVDLFYLHHVEQRPELKGKEFVFNGSVYYWNEKDNKCQIKIPSSAKNYFRVGDDYFEYVDIPDKYGHLNKTYHKRQKGTITDDNGKDIFKHINKYKAFTNVPDHLNYQRVIHNCFNIYHPFTHEPEEGDCSLTLEFIQHIFGKEPVQINESLTVERWQLGLDYLTILYKYPQQILPILCLVSRERQTGKTTFLQWLQQIFTENAIIVGNQDLENNFNSHWVGKLIIGCDETKIEKLVVMEKIKSLSTASTIMKEGKGTDQIKMDFFGKFILLSNNDDNFANIDSEEIRFWVIKVPTITKRNVDLLKDLADEIPQFLYYLNNRALITPKLERHWFETRLLQTAELDAIKENSRPSLEKLIQQNIKHLFEVSGWQTFHMSLEDVLVHIAKRKDADKIYVQRTLKQMGYKTAGVTRSLQFPFIKDDFDVNTGSMKKSVVAKETAGRYYTFHRADFISPEEEEETNIDNLQLL